MQGHVFDSLLTAGARAEALYTLQTVVHGSTAPGFLFASGLRGRPAPRAPLRLRHVPPRAAAAVRARGRLRAPPALPLRLEDRARGHARPAGGPVRLRRAAGDRGDASSRCWRCSGWRAGAGRRRRRWRPSLVLAAGPCVWASGVSARACPSPSPPTSTWRGRRRSSPSSPSPPSCSRARWRGRRSGRQEPATRRRRGLAFGLGRSSPPACCSRSRSPAACTSGASRPPTRSCGWARCCSCSSAVEAFARWSWKAIRPLALLGHETLLVYVLHLLILFGGVVRRLRPAALPRDARLRRRGAGAASPCCPWSTPRPGRGTG